MSPSDVADDRLRSTVHPADDPVFVDHVRRDTHTLERILDFRVEMFEATH